MEKTVFTFLKKTLFFFGVFYQYKSGFVCCIITCLLFLMHIGIGKVYVNKWAKTFDDWEKGHFRAIYSELI